MSTAEYAVSRYWEGGNALALAIVPAATVAAFLTYSKLAHVVSDYQVDAQVLFTYTITVFSIAFGSVVSLFALIACKPNALIQRVASSIAFSRVIMNIKVTMIFMAIAIGFCFIVGVIKLEPSFVLDSHSVIFVLWASFSSLTAMLFARTIRLVFLLI